MRLRPPVLGAGVTTTHMVVDAQYLKPLHVDRNPPVGYYTLIDGHKRTVLRFSCTDQIFETPLGETLPGDEKLVGTFWFEPDDSTLVLRLEHEQLGFRYVSTEMAVSFESNLVLLKDKYLRN